MRDKGNLQVNRRGFTLIELLVVIAVIALLLAILLPTMQSVRRKTRALVCQSNLRQWGPILEQYLNENNGRFPFGSGAGAWLLRGGAPSNDPARSYVPYTLRTDGIARCPMTVKGQGRARGMQDCQIRHPNGGEVVWRATIALGCTFEAWEILVPEPRFCASYGMNGWLSADNITLAADALNAPIFWIKGKSNIPVFLDCAGPASIPRNTDRPPKDPIQSLVSSQIAPFCLDRHDAHTNGLFLDWSVRKVGVKQLWTLKWHSNFNVSGQWTLAGGVTPERWPEWMRRFKDY